MRRHGAAPRVARGRRGQDRRMPIKRRSSSTPPWTSARPPSRTASASPRSACAARTRYRPTDAPPSTPGTPAAKTTPSAATRTRTTTGSPSTVGAAKPGKPGGPKSATASKKTTTAPRKRAPAKRTAPTGTTARLRRARRRARPRRAAATRSGTPRSGAANVLRMDPAERAALARAKARLDRLDFYPAAGPHGPGPHPPHAVAVPHPGLPALPRLRGRAADPDPQAARGDLRRPDRPRALPRVAGPASAPADVDLVPLPGLPRTTRTRSRPGAPRPRPARRPRCPWPRRSATS